MNQNGLVFFSNEIEIICRILSLHMHSVRELDRDDEEYYKEMEKLMQKIIEYQNEHNIILT